jgi:tyrosine 2,3-aminomutase
MIVRGEGMTVLDVYQVAVHRDKVELDPAQLTKVESANQRIQRWGQERHPIYGVNTSFGEMTHIIIPPQFKSLLQENLLRSHAAGGGAAFGDAAVRSMMVCRLNCLMKGYSGVSPAAVHLLAEMLNRGIHPIIPEQGSLGASGDLAPLAHLALPLIGDGMVRVDGRVRKSAEVLAEQGLEPLQLGFKEALALINGTSAMTGTASLALVHAFKLLQLELLASADFVQCLRGSTRAYEARGHELKNHHGQMFVAGVLRRLLEGGELARDHRDLMREIYQETAQSDDVVNTTTYLQQAYSLRCIPQILGPAVDSLLFCRRIVEEEINSCNDNPLIFDHPEETFHGGNFHGQYVAMACDFVSIAVAEIGVLAERQVNRLLDPYLNGTLPDFLAGGQTGLNCGFAGGQYLATSVASENLDLAAPSSIKSIPSNGGNQDVVSMGLIAARKSLRLCEHVTTIESVLVSSCLQAAHLIGPEKFNAPIREWHDQFAKIAGRYDDDFPLHEMFDAVRGFLTSPECWSLLDRFVAPDLH